MSILETINLWISVIGAFIFSLSVIYLFLPERGKTIMFNFIAGSIGSFLELAVLANLIVDGVIVLMHAIGKFIIVAAFLVATTIVLNNIMLVYGFELISSENELMPLIKYFKSKESWVPVTALLATIVAFGHFRNLKHTLSKSTNA
ncbi:MAG: hypothetical protein ABW092_19930 [Candidatus Thiodiazotropha sp.]